MTYFFDLGGQRFLGAAGDLSYELVELALAEDAVAFAFELEWGRARDHWLTHRAGRAGGWATHCRSSLTHVNR